jgi:hypothetical protein
MNTFHSLRQDFIDTASRAVMNSPEVLIHARADGRVKAITDMVNMGFMEKSAAFDQITLITQARDDVLNRLSEIKSQPLEAIAA